jgi:hypothetical protein
MASEEEIEENSKYLWELFANYKEDYAKEITELIDSGNIDINRSYGRIKTTPLYLASYYGMDNIVKQIIEKDVEIDIDIENRIKETPLFAAALNGHINIVKKLIEKGAKIDNQDRGGDTPLFSAALNGHLDIVKILIEKGAKIDNKNRDGDTPLFAAALNGHLNIVEILLEEGADRKIANNDGQTPSDIAMKRFIDTGDNKYSIVSKMITDYPNKESSESNPVENIFTNGSYKKETPDAIPTEKETPDAIPKETHDAIPTEKETPDAINDDGFTYNPLHKATIKNVSYNKLLNAFKGNGIKEKTLRKGGKHRKQKTRRKRNTKSHKKRR